jgi:dihydrofolate reductase
MNDKDTYNECKVKLIVAICKGGGIGINNKIPWKISDDLKYFSKLTSGEYGKYMIDTKKYISTGKSAAKICKEELNIQKNVIIMGKNTWLSLPTYPKSLTYRDSVIVSTTIPESKELLDDKEYDYDINIHFSSITRAIHFCSSRRDIVTIDELNTSELHRDKKHVKCNEREIMVNSGSKKYNDIWIIGGAKVYENIINMNTDVNKEIIIDEFYITYIDKEYKCDTFFPSIENMNLYCLNSIEAKVCKCEDDNGISDVNVYYLVFKLLNKNEIKTDNFTLNINPAIATDENIEFIKKLKIS